ncbi:hypothetical protein AB0D67_33350 [Streptosporangium sp. NPDC048047]|uniref:hypothetical protein n=1 Tax=Streptosporangium sp. NPDC048047 TaxID=3155748 RepID=UPI0034357D0B
MKAQPPLECRHCGCELERRVGPNGPVHLRRVSRWDLDTDRVPCAESETTGKHEPVPSQGTPILGTR